MTHEPASLLVDGYNVLGVWRGLYHRRRFPAFPTPAMLVRLLDRYARERGVGVSVVFDGRREGARGGDKTVSIVYTARGEEADDYLIRLARELGGACRVVSSDRRVRAGCAAAGARTRPAGVFLEQLEPLEDALDATRDP